ncbi:hypothetical protein N657DRAFT_336336 [Parathielavia appendiculata]|uniref:Uncharacterized protein n=1 Tax=Parathielavia appendiculata TaxID=2587402 RepID=A0AAN6U1T9_9PEZI|nr:hypothetical protein N657DRAFT_336336 [Parathielavia appendiculata]
MLNGQSKPDGHAQAPKRPHESENWEAGCGQPGTPATICSPLLASARHWRHRSRARIWQIAQQVTKRMKGSAYLAALAVNPPWRARRREGLKAGGSGIRWAVCVSTSGRCVLWRTNLCYRVKMSWIESLRPGLASYQWGIRRLSSDSGSLPVSWGCLKCDESSSLRFKNAVRLKELGVALSKDKV